MTITAAAGARQPLIGMGATEGVPRNYSMLPLDSRLDMARMIWGHDGLGFRVCKLWGDQRWAHNGAQMLSSYKRFYDDINSVQPNMIWLYGATGQAASEGLENYAARHAQVIADCQNVDGSWGLNVVNLTGVPDRRPGVGRGNANYQAAATYNITYHVASGGNVAFSIAPLELVTLVSAPTMGPASPGSVK